MPLRVGQSPPATDRFVVEGSRIKCTSQVEEYQQQRNSNYECSAASRCSRSARQQQQQQQQQLNHRRRQNDILSDIGNTHRAILNQAQSSLGRRNTPKRMVHNEASSSGNAAVSLSGASSRLLSNGNSHHNRSSPDSLSSCCRSAIAAASSKPAVVATDTGTTTTTTTIESSSSRRATSGAMSISAALAILLMIITLLASSLPVAHSVDCFKCTSRNGSNPACEDPFHNLNTTRTTSPMLPEPAPNVTYHTPCYAGKKGREGLFPASACIKLIGTFETTGESLVVRHCALDSGTLTQDTELARMSHCGKFQFESDLLQGCVLACPEDACNSSPESLWRSSSSPSANLLLLFLFLPLFHYLLMSSHLLHSSPLPLLGCTQQQ